MKRCPGCKRETITRFARLRALVFSRPACPGCGTRISFFPGAHLAFVAACVSAALIGLSIGVRLDLAPPLNLAIGLGVTLLIAVVPACALMLKAAALKGLPPEEYEGFFDRWGVFEIAALVVFLVLVWLVLHYA